MSSADPLAAPTTPAAGSPPAKAAAPTDAEIAAVAPLPKKKSSLGIVLVLFVVLLLIGGGAAAAWMLMGAGGTSGPVATSGGPTGAPVRAEPPAPPPPFAAQLAALAGEAASDPAAAPALDRAIGKLPKLAAAASAELHSLPIDPTAPPRLIVAAGGQPSAGDNSSFPRHERWEIQFPPGNTIESYTRQMDFFRIELGIIGGSDQVTYLTNLSEPVPAKRTAPATAEQRLYLVWRRGDMRQADDQLAVRAQVPLTGKIVAHFCPPELEAMLAATEDAHATRLNIPKIRRTAFGIRSRGENAFEFYVTEMQADPT